MKRILPYPLLWIGLMVTWLMLNDSIAPGHLLLGAIIATIACWTVVPLQLPKPKLRKIGSIFKLIGTVFVDSVRSNLEVFWVVLTGRAPRSAFITVPLELTDPTGLAILACIVTATPGSAWVHYDSRKSTVLIHILDTADEAAWNAMLKHKYERLLMEIFQ